MKVFCNIIKYDSGKKEMMPFSNSEYKFYSFRVSYVEGDNYSLLSESPIVKKESGVRNYSFGGVTWGFDVDNDFLFIHNAEINL